MANLKLAEKLNDRIQFFTSLLIPVSLYFIATDEELHFESNLQNLLNSYQGVFYGKNLDPSLLQGLETIPQISIQ